MEKWRIWDNKPALRKMSARCYTQPCPRHLCPKMHSDCCVLCVRQVTVCENQMSNLPVSLFQCVYECSQKSQLKFCGKLLQDQKWKKPFESVGFTPPMRHLFHAVPQGSLVPGSSQYQISSPACRRPRPKCLARQAWCWISETSSTPLTRNCAVLFDMRLPRGLLFFSLDTFLSTL